MFAKLLKYEWKSTSRLLGVFSVAAAAAGGLGAVALRFLVNYASGAADSAAGEQGKVVRAMTVSGLGMLLFFVVLALAAYYLGTQIVLLHRFYKNKFTDEGYLIFTLPVRSQEIVLASWVNMLIWSAISILVIGASAMAMLLGATMGIEEPFLDILVENSRMLYDEAFSEYGVMYYVMSVLEPVLEWLVAPMITMTCITIGAVGAKKHKILLAIAIYYGYSMVSGIVETVISSVVAIMVYTTDVYSVSGISQICGTLIQLLLGIGCWFLTNHLMCKKLNLP